MTDHQPLKYIMDPERAVPATAAARMQRWCLFLSGFCYKILYRNTKQHGNCDGLSRLPSTNQPPEEQDGEELFINTIIETLPVTYAEIRNATRKDPTLSQVVRYTESGWPPTIEEPALLPFFNRRQEVSLHHQIVMWGTRVVIPTRLRQRVLQTLHEGHTGIVKMKGLARSFVWWETIDRDIETECKSCPGCQAVSNEPPSAPLHRWEYPQQPWQRLHVDFAGPFRGHNYLVVADAYSKWPEIFQMRTTTAEETVATLRTLCGWAFRKLWCLTTVPNSPEACFKTLCKGMGSDMFEELPVTRQQTGWLNG